MTSSGHGPSLEIERSFLLARMPNLPATDDIWQIEQGYLPSGGEVEGRVRRTRLPSGELKHFHTVKRGMGLVREEVERSISSGEFEGLWALTIGRRLRKTRHRVHDGAFVWEVDEFFDLPPIEGRALVMAEVEIPESVDPASVPLPPWLTEVLIREVTEEPRFRNASIALQSVTIRVL